MIEEKEDGDDVCPRVREEEMLFGFTISLSCMTNEAFHIQTHNTRFFCHDGDFAFLYLANDIFSPNLKVSIKQK